MDRVWIHLQIEKWTPSIAKRFKVLFEQLCGDLWETGVSHLYANIHHDDSLLQKHATLFGFHLLVSSEQFGIWIKDL